MKQQHTIGKPLRHGEGSFDREGTIRQIYQRVLELQNEAICERALNSASIARSTATIPGPAGRKSKPVDIAHEDITPTNARTTDNGHSNVQTVDRCMPLQVASAQREWASRRKQRPAPQRTTHKQDSRKPAHVPLANA